MKNSKGVVARTAMMTVAIAMAALTLSGCATVKGAGRDITSVGQAGENVIKGK
jgi:predicted small secreted protein